MIHGHYKKQRNILAMQDINQLSQEDYFTVKRIFLDAIDKPTDDVVPFLHAQCQHNQKMFDILSSLIATHRYSETLSPQMPFSNQHEINHTIVDGDKIGKFIIKKAIGSGGMGDVYLANRANEVQQKVAVKVLKNKLNQQAFKRFQLEKNLLAQLEHPGIARLIDTGMENGLTYYAMEYVDGIPIDQFCKNNKLTIKQRLKLFKKVCDVVSFAHSHFIIHRDLKPQNILITQQGDVKLLDFGIAKPLHQYYTNDQLAKTTHGLCALTPQYAAPEQFNKGLIGVPCDVYALGLLLFELLTGTEAQNVKGLSLLEIQQAITHHIPANASQIVLEKKIPAKPFGLKTSQQLNRRLRGDLDAIIHNAIKKEPQKRYQTVKEIVTDIDRHLNYQPISVRNNILSYRFIKFIKRRWFPILSINTILLITLFSLFFIMKERNNAINEHQLSQQMADLIIATFKAASEKQKQQRKTTAKAILDEGIKQIKGQTNKNVQDQLLLTMGRIYYDLSDYDTALDLITNTKIETPESFLLKAQIYQQKNHHDLALKTLNRFQYKHNTDEELSYLSLRSLILKNIDPIQAKITAQKMLHSAHQIHGDKSLDFANHLIMYNHNFADVTHIDINIKHYKSVISIFNHHHLSNDQRLTSTYQQLAEAYHYKGLSNILVKKPTESVNEIIRSNIKPPVMLSTINHQQNKAIPLQHKYQMQRLSLLKDMQ